MHNEYEQLARLVGEAIARRWLEILDQRRRGTPLAKPGQRGGGISKPPGKRRPPRHKRSHRGTDSPAE